MHQRNSYSPNTLKGIEGMKRIFVIIRNILSQNSPLDWVVIALGVLAERLPLAVKNVRSPKPVNEVSWQNYVILQEFVRTIPNLPREYGFLSRRSIEIFESIIGIELSRSLFVTRRRLEKCTDFVSHIENLEQTWWNESINPFHASKLVGALHYIVHGSDSPPPVLRKKETVAIGNNTHFEGTISGQERFLTSDQVGCIVMYCQRGEKFFFAHYSTNPVYESSMWQGFELWLSESLKQPSAYDISKNSELVLNAHIMSYKTNYYCEKLVNLINEYSTPVQFHLYGRPKAESRDTQILPLPDGEPDIRQLIYTYPNVSTWADLDFTQSKPLLPSSIV
jgi:hypothetical protein